MPRLKNPQEAPPFGWSYLQVQISPGVPVTGFSIDDLARKVLELRRANPGISAQYNLSLDLNVVTNECNEQNAQRCLAHGWHHFVEAEAAGPPNPSFSKPQRLPRVVAVAAGTGLKRAVVGVATIRDWWLGDSLKPVDYSLAEKRAQVCITCPLNIEPNFFDRLAANIADTFKGLVVAKQDMELKTSVDDKLFSCSACGCWNPLKVWVGLPHIVKNMKSEEKTKLDPKCWILHES